MRIQRLRLLEGARKARGVAVVIDVFRAFTTAAVLLDQGAARIVAVAGLETAYNLKKANPEYVLMGERDFVKQPGFDHGNSPSAILGLDFSGKTVVHTTSAGTQGLVAALGGARVCLTGAFVNASATARLVGELAAEGEIVSLVAMGTAGREPSLEDERLAEYLQALLHDKGADAEDIAEGVEEELRHTPPAKKFFDPAADYAPEADFRLCLTPDRYRFAIRAQPAPPELGGNEAAVLTKVDAA